MKDSPRGVQQQHITFLWRNADKLNFTVKIAVEKNRAKGRDGQEDIYIRQQLNPSYKSTPHAPFALLQQPYYDISVVQLHLYYLYISIYLIDKICELEYVLQSRVLLCLAPLSNNITCIYVYYVYTIQVQSQIENLIRYW